MYEILEKPVNHFCKGRPVLVYVKRRSSNTRYRTAGSWRVRKHTLCNRVLIWYYYQFWQWRSPCDCKESKQAGELAGEKTFSSLKTNAKKNVTERKKHRSRRALPTSQNQHLRPLPRSIFHASPSRHWPEARENVSGLAAVLRCSSYSAAVPVR